MGLMTKFAPSDQRSILLLNSRETPCTTADIAMQTSRITKDQTMGRYILCNYRAGSNQRKLTNGHATYNHCRCTERGSITYKRRRHLPVIRTFQLAIGSDCTWKHIIGKTHVRTNKNTIFKRHSLKN